MRGDLRSRHRLPSPAVPTSRPARLRRQTRQPEGQSHGRTPHFCCLVDGPETDGSRLIPLPLNDRRVALRSRSRRRWRRVRDHPLSAFQFAGVVTNHGSEATRN